MKEKKTSPLLDRPIAPLPTDELLAWYDAGHRDLPWRHKPTPYRVWVSEIMLQQTRAEAVRPYFERFTEVLPNVNALAEAEDDVLNKLWQGLGYYSRVRNLKAAAEVIRRDYGGEIPRDHTVLRTLPGIGPYTAGAIASIAYGEAVPAVDGNVLRVLSRFWGDERYISDPTLRGEYERLLQRYIPADRAGDFTQSLIELGATLCGPNTKPACEECPLRGACVAFGESKTDCIPCRQKKKPRRQERRTVLVILAGDAVLLRKRPESGLLAGLYEFPTIVGDPTPNEVYRHLGELGVTPERIEEMPPAVHIFTHVEWHMRGLKVGAKDYGIRRDTPLFFLYENGKTLKKSGTALIDHTPGVFEDAGRVLEVEYVWASREGFAEKYAVPSAFQAFIPEGFAR